ARRLHPTGTAPPGHGGRAHRYAGTAGGGGRRRRRGGRRGVREAGRDPVEHDQRQRWRGRGCGDQLGRRRRGREEAAMRDERSRHLRRLNRLRASARRWTVTAAALVGATAVLAPYQGLRPLDAVWSSEEQTSELQSRENLVCRLLLE